MNKPSQKGKLSVLFPQLHIKGLLKAEQYVSVNLFAVHGLFLQVRNVTGNTADTFLEYIQRNIPEGVSMSAEQTSLESVPEFFELPPQAQAFRDEKKEPS